MIDGDVRAIPKGLYTPTIEGADDTLRQDTMNNAKAVTEILFQNFLETRLHRELIQSSNTDLPFCMSLRRSWFKRAKSMVI